MNYALLENEVIDLLEELEIALDVFMKSLKKLLFVIFMTFRKDNCFLQPSFQLKMRKMKILVLIKEKNNENDQVKNIQLIEKIQKVFYSSFSTRNFLQTQQI